MAVAQRREDGVTIKLISEDFGISEACLQNWLRRAAAYLSQANLPGKGSTRS